MKQYKRKELLGIGIDFGLKLYIWQDPHQPRDVVSDGEDDEWRAPPGSLLGSDVLARVYHSSDFASAAQASQQEVEIVPAECPDFASAAQESRQELEIGPANKPTGTEPRYTTAQESGQELGNVTETSPDFASAPQESRQELDIAPAKASGTLAPRRQYAGAALARAHKYGQRQTTATASQTPKYSSWGMTMIAKEFVRQHSTDQYTRFDPSTPYRVQAVKGVHPFPATVFYDYKGYHLCMDPDIINPREIPQLPVRLDDRLVALAYEGFSCSDRHRLWPSEFNFDGMVRPGRIPLGFAAKHEYKVGDVDFDGSVLQPGEEGWYYLWLGGFHCLIGKEGMDAGRFQSPDFSCQRIVGFAFRKSHRAEIQAPPGVESER